jgi:hypothetical protein
MKRCAVSLPFALLAAFLALIPAAGSVSARQPTLEDALAKAAQYVAAFADPSKVLVCEESYEHTYFRRMVNTAGGSERLPQGGRQWVAEKMVVATPVDEKAGFPFTEFRDIINLDKKPARDGVSRLSKLLVEPKLQSLTEAQGITREATGYQSGRFDRMVLLPRLSLVFLHASNQPRFTFTKGGGRTIKGVKTVEVKFQEKDTPTIIKTATGQNAPSSGSFWIDPATGAILSSFLKNGDSSELWDEITTTYALDQTTGLWLPSSMMEKMYDTKDEKEIDGKGAFKNWRFVPRG